MKRDSIHVLADSRDRWGRPSGTERPFTRLALESNASPLDHREARGQPASQLRNRLLSPAAERKVLFWLAACLDKIILQCSFILF